MLKPALLAAVHALAATVIAISCGGCDYIHAAINDRLKEAARTGDARGAYLSLLAGADANARDSSGASVLHVAVTANFEPLVDVLLVKGANPEAKDPRGRTPLFAAQHSRLVRLLAARGAALDARDPIGNTPLTFALFSG